MCQRRQNSVKLLGDVGEVEVFGELEAQHPAQADGHQGIAAEKSK